MIRRLPDLRHDPSCFEVGEYMQTDGVGIVIEAIRGKCIHIVVTCVPEGRVLPAGMEELRPNQRLRLIPEATPGRWCLASDSHQPAGLRVWFNRVFRGKEPGWHPPYVLDADPKRFASAFRIPVEEHGNGQS